MDIFWGFILFLCGVVLTTCWFMRTNKADRMNRDLMAEDIKKLRADLCALSITIGVIEKQRPSKIDNIEIADSIKLVRGEYQVLRDVVLGVQNRIADLRPIHVHKYQLPETKPKRKERSV